MKLITPIIAAVMFGSVSAGAATGNLEIDHLGVNNTLVRVKGSGRYLMLPVQESNEDARINVLVDGKVAETIYVRLATSKADFSVPFDLSPYKGRNVIFDIVTPQGRGSVREAKDDACWRGIELTDTVSKTDREKRFRPVFHHSPFSGWMNDPNGMFYDAESGIWHLYYQHNPYGSKWQNMTWGHSWSSDLVNWEHGDEAIRPDGLGSIFSGSCVVDKEGTAGYGPGAVVAIYTSAGTSQIQSLAVSTNKGSSFAKYPANPVITLESEARDPNMFWNSETGEWNLILAHALDHEMLFFTSPDLKNWTLQSGFGKGEGAQGGVWECPDLFPLPVDGSDLQKWVLICNINPGGPFGGSAVQYFTGEWDGRTFRADTDSEGRIPTKWLDYGKDNYALVSWSDTPDGRRTAIGWMSNWQYAADVPTSQFRSANTLPREIGLFTGPDGQVYASGVPSPEIDALRGKVSVAVAKAKLGKTPRIYRLPQSGLFEIECGVDARNTESVTLTLSNPEGDEVVMTYDPAAHTFAVDRRRSGIVDFNENFPAVTVAPTFETDGRATLRIIVDRSSVEVFGNEGRFTMTNLVFPNSPYTRLSVASAGGGARLSGLRIYPLELR